MKNSKGITLATLVVMIATIILLSSIAIGFGYKYLIETKEADKEYFVEILSNAVVERESYFNINSIEYPRVGYEVKDVGSLEKIIQRYIPALRANNPEFLFERGLWYIVDNKTAEKLGVKGSSSYIDAYDATSTNEMTLTLVDYYSGAVYIFDTKGMDLGDINDGISGDVIKPDDGHVHDYNLPFPTCTEDRKCLICGFVEKIALGHDYGGEKPAEPVDNEFHYKKECTRCGAKGGYERHQSLNGFAHYISGDGSWYHYNGCSICGWSEDIGNYDKCEIVYKSISDTEHVKQCKICLHEEKSEHNYKYAYIDGSYHEKVCTICGYVSIQYEHHEDNDGDRFCDKCLGEITIEDNPLLVNVMIKNKEYPDSHFVTIGETIQLIFTADKMITDAKVTICGYGGDNIKYTYSSDKLTCTAELYVDEHIIIAQNTKVTFTIDCKSITTGKWLTSPMAATTNAESYLIYDSIAPTIQYILKESY